MLTRPDIQDQTIISRLFEEYGLRAAQLDFLPIGADVNTAVFQAVTLDEAQFFVKLMEGSFEEINVAVPQYLYTQGIQAIIPPLVTYARRLWAELPPYKMVLYPFFEGESGYEQELSGPQWLEFGASLKAIHTTQLPTSLARLVPCETYSPYWREMVTAFQSQIESTSYEDHSADQLARFMQSHRDQIARLVARADLLGLALRSCGLQLVLCHSDIHAGNLLLGVHDALHIVDWDNPTFSPKERDLILVGGSPTWNDPAGEALFYQGYGPTEIDGMALAYYRYERIIQDIAAYCEQLLLTGTGGADREKSLFHFTGQFLPGHEIEIAFQTDHALL